MLQKPKDMELQKSRGPPIYLVPVMPQCLTQVWAQNVFQEALLDLLPISDTIATSYLVLLQFLCP